MCGIAAIFAYQSSAPGVETGELTVIRDQMTARGPDGCGLWFDEQRRIGLGHRRLSIIDLSDAGAQPMLLPERQLAIVFNGEIYNYRELRATLEQQGHVFHSSCDTEVLLRLYAQKGRTMLDDLRGMYAFALWDGVQRGLFLARDPFGIKPLYLADDGKTLRVASQVKALLAGGKINTAPEPAGHVGFFLWGHVPDPYTLYRGIRALPAGTSLWLGAHGEREQHTFYTIPEMLRSSDATLAHWMGEWQGVRASGEVSNSASKFQLSAFLRDSVAHHLIADVPVGVFLSSGLDSTTLAALAAEQGGQLRTVTLGFEEYRGTTSDETPLAELVARQYGAQHQTIWVQRQDFQDQVENLFAAMDQPSTDGVNTYFVSLAAKRAGLKVALSGLGGDEMFGGYPSFSQLPRTVSAFQPFGLSALQPLGRAFRFVSAPVLKHFTSPKYAGLLEYGGSYGGAYLLRRGMFMPWELPEILDADLVREGWAELNTLNALNATANLCPISAFSFQLSAFPARLRVSSLEMSWYMRNQLLRDSDWAGMAHSLEIRVPLVDTTLLRSLAPLLGGETPPTKLDMARSPLSALPSSVLDRHTTGFQIPVRDWLGEGTRNSEPRTWNSTERGLRGWARHVHSRFPGSNSVLVRSARVRAPKSPIVNRPMSRRSAAQTDGPCSLPPASALHVLALVTDAFGGHGGIAKFNRDLLSAVCSHQPVTQVVCLPRLMPNPPGELPEKLDWETKALGGKMRFLRSVVKTSRKNSFDMIVCGHINLLPAAFLARRFLRPLISGFRPPIVMVIHGVDAWQPTRSRLANRLALRVDHVIAVSNLTRERFISWSGVDAGRVTILPNCVDLSLLTPGPKPTQLVSRYKLEGKTVLMTLGRLDSEERYKGFDEVLEILPRLAEKNSKIAYLIVGDGGDRTRLEAKALNLGVANRVVFAGRIPDSEKVDHYRLADCYVMPSRGEGFGIVFLEAMACGIPVIGSRVDGSREALRNGELGALVDPSNAAEITLAIETALRQPAGTVPAGLLYFPGNNSSPGLLNC